MEHQTPIRITAIALLLVIFQSHSFFAIETDYCSCYSFHKIPKNWEDSNKICQDNNGTVISMETEEEYQFINKTIQSLDVGENEWYIGLRRISTNYWRWNSGHVNKTIDKWLPGEPRGSEGCVKMIKHYKGRGLFDDTRCDIRYMFICEYNEVQSCSSINNKWCFLPPNLPTTKETTTTPSTTSDKKSTAVIYSSAEKGQQTKAFIQTTKPEGNINDPQSKSTGSKAFPLVTVTVALGAVLAVSVCVLVFVCCWKRRNRGEARATPNNVC